MRVMVMFDLPSVTSRDLKIYRRFRKFLIDEGFAMLQESIYTKLALNGTQVKTISKHIEANAPLRGSVFVMIVTEKQFANMRLLTGEVPVRQLQSANRLVIL